MKDAPVRWAKRFHNGIFWGWASLRLQLLLQHGFVIRLGSGERIRALQLISESVFDEPSCCLESTIKENRSCERFQGVSQKRVFAPASAPFFASSKSQEVAQFKPPRSLSQGRLAHQPMLHSRQFALGALRVRMTQIVRDD